METVVSFVCARFKPIGSYKKRKVPTGKYKKSLFGQSEICETRNAPCVRMDVASPREILC